jgi:hypothetical protein
MSEFEHLRTTTTNQNLIQEKVTSRLNSGNASYHSIQSFLYSCLLLKNLKIRIYKPIILFCMGIELDRLCGLVVRVPGC